jgi:Tfp pilus assembly PilM family ATPase
MSKCLAIDWDRSTVRFLYASGTASKPPLRILAAESVTLTEAGECSDKEAAIQLGTQLRAVLDRHGIGRMPALVAVERGGIELVPLTLPPATDAELPELVANEVLRESTLAADGAAFDFFPFSDDASATRKVLAAVLPPERHERIEAMAEAARLRPQRLLPRFFAVAALFQRLAPPSEEWHLLVHPGAEEVDFLVFRTGRVVFARAARLPSTTDDEQRDAWLESEIYRTLTVATAEVGETHVVEGVYVFGGHEEYRALCEHVRERLLLPAHVLNPLEEYELPPDFAPQHPGRFAALLGMLIDEAENRPPAIDFLHPHRPAQRVGRRKVASFAAAILLLAAILGGGYLWHTLSKVWKIGDQLAVELKQLDSRVRQEAKLRQLTSAIHAWQGNEVVWLDELRGFSERFPPAQDAMVLRMQMNASPTGGGMMLFQGLVRDPSLIVHLEYALRDPCHAVQSRRIQTGSRPDEQYTHLFDATIAISKHKQESQDDAPSR